MSQTDEATFKLAEGNGSTKTFPWNHPIRRSTDFTMKLIVHATGMLEPLVEGIGNDYTVSISDTFDSADFILNASVSAPTSAKTVIIYRTSAFDQGSNYIPHEFIEGDLDLKTQSDLSIIEVLNRCVKVQVADNTDYNGRTPFDPTLPTVEGATASNVLQLNATKTAFEWVAAEVMTDAEVKTAYENNADTNAFTDAEKTSLGTMEDNADVTDEANVTAALDGATLTAVTVDTADKVIVQDDSDSDNIKTVTAQSIRDLLGVGPVAVSAKISEAAGISMGECAYVSGSTGTAMTASLADNTDFDKSNVIALAASTGDNNDTINFVSLGILSGFDTSALSEGDPFWLSTAGTLTATNPSGINAVIEIGICVRSHATLGSVYVHINSQTVTNTYDGTVRHQVVNSSTGTSAVSSYTMVNDAGHRVSISLNGSSHSVGENFNLYSEGYGTFLFLQNGSASFEWYADAGDTHSAVNLAKIMELASDGELIITGSERIIHTATEADDHAMEIDLDGAGFGDVKAIDIEYDTGALATGSDEAIILVDINDIDATGGSIYAVETLVTDGSSDKVCASKAGAGVCPILQDSGSFANPTTGTNDTVSTDVPAMIDGSTGTNTTIFVADDDYILIGGASAFTEIEFIINTPASNPGIKPTFAYSISGSHQFTTFTPVDGTNGMRNTGIVAWDASDLTAHVANSDTSTFDIKITRTHNSVGSVSLHYAKTAATVVYEWDKDGNVSINDLSLAGDLEISSSTPRTVLENTSAAANEKRWAIRGLATGELEIEARNDADGLGGSVLRAVRTGSAIDLVEIGADLNVLGTITADNLPSGWREFIEPSSEGGLIATDAGGPGAALNFREYQQSSNAQSAKWVLKFDDTTPEFATFQIMLPPQYDDTADIDITILATKHTGVASGEFVLWGALAAVFEAGDDLGSLTYGSLVQGQMTMPVSKDEVASRVITVTPANSTSGTVLFLEGTIKRVAASGSDTLVDDASVIGIIISQS